MTLTQSGASGSFLEEGWLSRGMVFSGAGAPARPRQRAGHRPSCSGSSAAPADLLQGGLQQSRAAWLSLSCFQQVPPVQLDSQLLKAVETGTCLDVREGRDRFEWCQGESLVPVLPAPNTSVTTLTFLPGPSFGCDSHHVEPPIGA